MQKNGLISFILHPDYLRGERELALYKSLLTYLCQIRAEKNVWIAVPREIDGWWRARNQMQLIVWNGNSQIQGEGSERARIAYASVTRDRLTYTLQAHC
jgi:hypothetical protein